MGNRTPAQLFCLIVGVVLVAAGLLGFITDSSFDTGAPLNGDELLGLEVNGWHNLVHIASGLFLLAMSPKRASAKTGAFAFAAIYVVVTIVGLADGNDILGILPINGFDNVLHLILAVAGIGAALASNAEDRGTTRTTAGARA
jgi:hypothetical protein